MCSTDTTLTYIHKGGLFCVFHPSSFDCCFVVQELPCSFLSVCHFSTAGACTAKELIHNSDGSLLSLVLLDLLLFFLSPQKAAPCIRST